MASTKDYSEFKNKFVKIVYLDSDRHSIARGILIKETDNVVLIKGDFSTISISKNSIIKISRQEQDGTRTN